MSEPEIHRTTAAAPETIHPRGIAGRTSIADPAAAKIAAVAIRAVPGVYALGSGGGRGLNVLRDAAAHDAHAVRVEVGQSQLAVDVSLVAIYGYPLNQVADAVRAAVYQAISDLVGLDVTEVNIEITDVHLPDAAGPHRPSQRQTINTEP